MKNETKQNITRQKKKTCGFIPIQNEEIKKIILCLLKWK